MNLDRHRQFDNAIADAAKDIKVLTRLSWPAGTMSKFLADWRRGKPQLPVVEYPSVDDLDSPARRLSDAADALAAIDDPIADYLRETAQSYVTLCELLAHAGGRVVVVEHVRRRSPGTAERRDGENVAAMGSVLDGVRAPAGRRPCRAYRRLRRPGPCNCLEPRSTP